MSSAALALEPDRSRWELAFEVFVHGHRRSGPMVSELLTTKLIANSTLSLISIISIFAV